MIAKLFKPKFPASVIRYVTRYGKAGPDELRILGGNTVSRDPEMLIREFMVSCDLKRNVLRPIIHASLSIPAGLSLSSAQWLSAAKCFLKELGFDPLEDHQFVVVQHLDRPHQHIHVIASRLSITTGKLVREVRGDYYQAHRAAASAAKVVGLSPVIPKRPRKWGPRLPAPRL
jgi:hypothetical protein